MRVVSFLAQYATVDHGRLDVIHGAIDLVIPSAGMYVAGIVYVRSNETGHPHELRYELVNAEGMTIYSSDNRPIVMHFPFTVAPPYPIKAAEFQLPHAVCCPSVFLQPGSYEWRVSVDGQSHDDWNARFTVVSSLAAA